MSLTFYILGALVVSGILALFMASLLDMISLPLVALGIRARKVFKTRKLEEKNGWLFALLISVTRVPIIILAATSFFVYLLSFFLPGDGVTITYELLLNTCWIIFIMRVGSIFFGGALFGEPIRDIMRSLRG